MASQWQADIILIFYGLKWTKGCRKGFAGEKPGVQYLAGNNHPDYRSRT